jgi:hypothetical protein
MNFPGIDEIGTGGARGVVHPGKNMGLKKDINSFKNSTKLEKGR